MISFRKLTAVVLVAGGLAMAFISASHAAVEAVEKVVYSFTGGNNDGWSANGPLITDGKGNFYGTTGVGGDGVGCTDTEGCGTVFKMTRGKVRVIYAFQNVSDGYFPSGGLLLGNDRNLYGTTSVGGDADVGTVFRVTPSGVHTVLYSFTGGSDGASPRPDLATDSDGNIYGTASAGGNGNCTNGCGTIFKLTPEGAFTLLYSFTGKSGDGAAPDGLVAGVDGNFYGVTNRRRQQPYLHRRLRHGFRDDSGWRGECALLFQG